MMDAIFKALADPTRRALLDRLLDKQGQTLTELVEDGVNFATSSPRSLLLGSDRETWPRRVSGLDCWVIKTHLSQEAYDRFDGRHPGARELPRTLHSLRREYQRGSGEIDYEVIVVDNGSPQPVSEELVTSFGPQFGLLTVDKPSPSPMAAINEAASRARMRSATGIEFRDLDTSIRDCVESLITVGEVEPRQRHEA